MYGPEDAALSARWISYSLVSRFELKKYRELVHYQSPDARGMRRLTGPSGQGGSGQGQGQGQMNPLAQMGPVVMSVGGKAGGLSFDHVLHKLQVCENSISSCTADGDQAELARSKETGSELQNLATSMTDIQDTLGGGLVGVKHRC